MGNSLLAVRGINHKYIVVGYEVLFESVPGVRYRRKMQEYYITSQLMDFEHWRENDIYVDLGAQTSLFVKYLREKKGIEAYGLDIEESIYKELGYYLQEDVTDTHFADNSVQGRACPVIRLMKLL